MRSILGIILLFITATASAMDAIGEIKRVGETVCIHTPSGYYYTLDLSAIPETYSDLGMFIIARTQSFHTLSAEELSVCNDIQAAEKMWRVAYNRGYPTRPARELICDGPDYCEMFQSDIEYDIGKPCENAIPTFSKPSPGEKEWRYYAGQTRYVVVCEYK